MSTGLLLMIWAVEELRVVLFVGVLDMADDGWKREQRQLGN